MAVEQRAPTVWTHRNPVYLAKRWQSKWGNLLLVERVVIGAHFPFRPNDCPDCVDRFEVGDADEPRAVELAERMLGREAPFALAESWRFCDEVLAWLPNDRTWSMDGCSVRDWADNVGPVRARYVLDGRSKATEIELPLDEYKPRRLTFTPVPAAERSARAVILTDEQRKEMSDVLESLEADAF